MRTRKVKKKKDTQKKLTKIPVIKRRLFKIWSEKVRERAGHQCEYCGIKKGDKNKNGKVTKIDAHHLLSRNVKNSPLKYDLFNGVAVCPICHKWGDDSFHRSSVTTMNWLLNNHPERYFYVLDTHNIKVDLENRNVLEEIERQLNSLEHLDIEKLKEIEASFPRPIKSVKPTLKTIGNLFECDPESSSSSES